MLTYQSTRNKAVEKSETQAILQGISKEGGLFVPKRIPQIDFALEEMITWDYQELAYRIMRLFFEGIKVENLKACIKTAYDEKFDTKVIAPLKVDATGNFLELFHGPTLAFKDMALSILPHLMITSKKYEKEEKDIVILTATSGDTGKAALEGFANVEGTRIVVFFPEQGVSAIQKRQMITQEGENTLVVGIKGNFDDAQTGVKKLFADEDYAKKLAEKGYVFSSANSINIGRLIPQIVYYFSAYAQMIQKGELVQGEKMNVAVPTGNFGNLLAAYYAKCMGLPINRLICASNENKVPYDFFREGIYNRNRDFYLTNSPSMDILISSNLERLLFHVSGEDTECVAELMTALKEKGVYTLNETMRENLKMFYAGYAGDVKTGEAINAVYTASGYLMDTHTAVAYAVYKDYQLETKDTTKTVIVSTASPYKFTGSVMDALGEETTGKTDFERLELMETLLNERMPKGISGLEKRAIQHQHVCEVDEMQAMIDNFLKSSCKVTPK